MLITAAVVSIILSIEKRAANKASMLIPRIAYRLEVSSSDLRKGSLRGIVLVLTRCGVGRAANETLPRVEKTCQEYGIGQHYTDCDPIMNRVEARETGPMIRWIIKHYDDLQSGRINRVIWHHAHENSIHQRDLTGSLIRLLTSKEYLLGNEYGEFYNKYLELEMDVWNGRPVVPYAKFDILALLDNLTQGTQMRFFNRTNSYGRWLAGSCSSFFVSAKLITQYSLDDYKRFLANIPKVVQALTGHPNLQYAATPEPSHLTAVVTERSWQVLFTNLTYPHYTVPLPPSFGSPHFVSYGRHGWSFGSVRDLSCSKLPGFQR